MTITVVDICRYPVKGLNAESLEDPGRHQLHSQIERCLSTKGREQGVWPLDLDDGGEDIEGQRFDVGRIGEVGIGHDRGRVGVGQDHPIAVGPQRPAGLRSGVIEFTSLADDDRARADEQDAVDVGPSAHGSNAPTHQVVELLEEVGFFI